MRSDADKLQEVVNLLSHVARRTGIGIRVVDEPMTDVDMALLVARAIAFEHDSVRLGVER